MPPYPGAGLGLAPAATSPTGDSSAGGGGGVAVGGGGGTGGTTFVGGAGSGAGCGAGGACGSEGGRVVEPRDGSRVRGSTYVSPGPTRTPRWTYGTGCSTSPLGPASASTSPSATVAPRRTCSAPRCVSDTLVSAKAMVTVRPFVGTCPAKVISPAAGDRTVCAPASATSMPRCWPAEYVFALTEKPRRTSPSAGHVNAHDGDARTSEHAKTDPTHKIHLQVDLVVRRANMDRRYREPAQAAMQCDRLVTESPDRAGFARCRSGARRRLRPFAALRPPRRVRRLRRARPPRQRRTAPVRPRLR